MRILEDISKISKQKPIHLKIKHMQHMRGNPCRSSFALYKIKGKESFELNFVQSFGSKNNSALQEWYIAY